MTCPDDRDGKTLDRITGGPWPILAIVAMALVLGLINLGRRSLWFDEAFAVLYAEKPFATMLYGTITQVEGAAADVHPLFFYSTPHIWMRAFGQSPAAVRALSVLLGTATVSAVIISLIHPYTLLVVDVVLVGYWLLITFRRRRFWLSTLPGPADDIERRALLRRYDIDYVFYGPRERRSGGLDPEQSDYLNPFFTHDDVSIYQVDMD